LFFPDFTPAIVVGPQPEQQMTGNGAAPPLLALSLVAELAHS